MRALRRRQYYQTFDFYFVLQLAATEITTHHEMVMTSLVTVATSLALLGGHQRRLLDKYFFGKYTFEKYTFEKKLYVFRF